MIFEKSYIIHTFGFSFPEENIMCSWLYNGFPKNRNWLFDLPELVGFLYRSKSKCTFVCR